jgi:hypothetical protein
MGKIKTALELAMERTEDVKGDRSSIDNYNAKQNGMKAANAFLAGEGGGLDGQIKKTPEASRDAFKEGLLEGFLVRLVIPATEEELAPLEKAGEGLAAVVADKRFPAVYKQFIQQIRGYPGEAEQYDKAIRQQYAPALRQKEEALSQQLGQAVRLDPMQDPEFVKFYKQNMDHLKENYQNLIDQVKSLARGIEPAD